MPTTTTACPACGASDLVWSVTLESIPAHVGVLWPTSREARDCPKGDLRLAFCRRCGYVFNAAFDPRIVDYELSYDNALHHSGVFRDYERTLAERLLERYDLYGKDLVEIGCGPAHFLGLLCKLGDNRGTGFDPSHDPDHADELAAGRVTVHREYFGEQHAHVPADLLCCRHVLEHIAEPAAFLAMLRRALGERDTVLYFEVPNALLALRELSVWDLLYEHCGYYTTESLGRLFRASGFDVLHLAEAYGGQFVGIEARPARATPDATADQRALDRLEGDVVAFEQHLHERLRHWEQRLDELARSGQRVAVWGAGGKTVGFMNLLPTAGHVDAVVDINPRKQGTYLAGTGHPIVAPEELPAREPGLVVVMNPIYSEEIAADVRRLGLDARVEAV